MASVEGGYDYDFVESPPDRLVCKICQSPCREAQLTECCGHVFCKCCLSKLRSSATVSQACPTCREEPFNAFVQREADREIKALKVYCPNKKDGCGWTGELVSIVKHNPLQQCGRCDKCDDVIHYSDIHLPTNCPCYCPHCDTTADREVISSEHKEKCNKCPLRCPNNCGQDDILQECMDDHKKVCPREMIQCEYQCGARVARNEVEKHNQEHIQLAHAVLSELKTAQLRSAETNAFPIKPHFTTIILVIVIAIQTTLLLSSYYTTTDLSLRQARLLIEELQNNISQNVEELTRAKSHIVQLQNDIIDLKVKETKHLENLRQAKSLVKQLQNEIKDLKVKKTEYLEDLKQSESLVKWLQNDMKDLKAKHSEELTNCKSGELKSQLNHVLSLLKSAYISYISKHDDESLWPLKLFISDEISDQVAPAAILKMSDFAKRKENKEQWYSKPFFAFQQGYQMCLNVYTDGIYDGEATHVSVYLYLMKGPPDDKLDQSSHWPLSGTFTIELLNQLNNNDHYSRKVTFRASTPSDVDAYDTGRGYDQFISHDILLHRNDNKYLKNDALYFRISYQTVDLDEYKIDTVMSFIGLVTLFIIIILLLCCYSWKEVKI